MKRKLIALLLVICLVLPLIPAAFAAETDLPMYYNYYGTEKEERKNAPLSCVLGHSTLCWFFTASTAGEEITSGLIFEPDEGTAKDAIALEYEAVDIWADPQVKLWRVSANALGSGKLVYTAQDGTRYALAVSIRMPVSSFSTTTELTKDSLMTLNAFFRVNEPFYYVFGGDVTIQNVVLINEEDLVGRVSLEILPQGNVCRITVTASNPDSDWLNLGLKFTLKGEQPAEDTWSSEDWISLEDATPRLHIRDVNYNDNGKPDGFWSYKIFRLRAEQGDRRRVGFFMGEEELALTDVAFTPADGTADDAVTAELDEGRYWVLSCSKVGSGKLRCTTTENVVYELPVIVSLPALGFYSSNVRGGESCLSEFIYDVKKETNEIWLMMEDGFDANSMPEITCRDMSGSQGEKPIEEIPENFKVEQIQRENGKLDLKITVLTSVPADGYSLRAKAGGRYSTLRIMDADKMTIWKSGPSALTVTIDGTEYVVGFCVGSLGDEIIDINDLGRWSLQFNPEQESAGGAYRPANRPGPAVVAATLDTSGGQRVFKEAPDEIQKLITVNRVWLERSSGSRGEDDNTDTFSFAETRQLSRNTGLSKDGIPLYVAYRTGAAYLCAEISIGGKSGEIYVQVHYEKATDVNINCKTVEEINNWLTANTDRIYDAALDAQERTTFTIWMTEQTYSGTIQIPARLAALRKHCGVRFSSPANGTTLTGSIELNGATLDPISRIHFVAADGNQSFALHNGTGYVSECSFTGYDTALSGGIMPVNCEFIDNETALILDVANAGSTNRDILRRNRFQNNETAVCIKSTNEFLSPYYVRAVDSTFTGNTVDFDVQCIGSFYFYRNFYAGTNGSMRSAIIKIGNQNLSGKSLSEIESLYKTGGTAVYVNPVRTAAPEAGEDAPELVLDPNLPVKLTSDDTQELLIAASSLETSTRIEIADETDQTIAEWSGFGTAQQASRLRARAAVQTAADSSSDTFNAGVAIRQQPDGSLAVTVEPSAALTAKTPLLRIPCTARSASVTLNGQSVASSLSGGQLSFRVTAGGIYSVKPLSVERKDGVLCIANAPEDAVHVIAAVYTQSGQMLASVTGPIVNGSAGLTLPPQASQSGCVCRVMLLDRDYRPAAPTTQLNG